MIANRIGTFFILLGLLLVALFVYSDLAKAPTCNLLLFGGISLALGIFLWLRNPAPPHQESGRFGILKKRGKK
jgi:multisubunit Na+/H+ antiporter MnhG subunit